MSQDTTTWEATLVRGLRMAVAESLGTHAPFGLDDSVLEYVEAESQGVEMETLPRDIAEWFGLDPRDPEWKRLWGHDAARVEWPVEAIAALTFRMIVDYLALHVTRLEERSGIVLGRQCRQARTFREIEAIATLVDARVRRISPSDDISKTMGRRLRPFWAQVRWRTEGEIPELPTGRFLELTVFSVLVLFLSLIGLAFSARLGRFVTDMQMTDANARTATMMITLVTISLVVVTAVLTAVVRIIYGSGSTMPRGIRTFGDLARIIATND
ncbi:MAG: hypothetical protein H6818_05685 [Phycisphaerales bacterium]|nr:hypothetical protein [Phycisphaerales bacterium]MCB9862754.1 hypothetical protein [Phycisphaerales bacterium]